MEGMRAYSQYMALKLHFTTDYDYFKYGGKSKAITESSFQKRKDVLFFRKIERRYNDEERLEYFVSNMIESGGRKWIGDMASISSEKIYAEWKKNNESFSYLFKQDMKYIKDFDSDVEKLWKVPNGSHPQILKFLLGKKIRMETVIATNRVLNFLNKWDNEIQEEFIWKDVSRSIKKYDPFLKYDIKIIKKIMREELK